MTPAVVLGGISLVRCFQHSGVPVVVVANDATEVALRSRFAWSKHVVAGYHQPDLLREQLVEIGRALGDRPPLFYGGDAAILFISRNRDALAPWFRFRMPAAESIDALVDKARFGALAARLGLPVPATLSSRA